MANLVLIRHGQSMWNLNNLFTGWVDIPLSEQGVAEAISAGQRLAAFSFDVIYVSTLIRAQQTAMIAMAYNRSKKVPVVQKAISAHADESERREAEWARIYNEATLSNTIPVYSAWQLNERYYGELQGLNKKETADRYGEEQVHIWRRSYAVPPPHGEALKNTAERTIPYFKEVIYPQLQQGKNILVSAHGNSLRSIVMHLDRLTEEQVLALELKTGDPILYKYEKGNLTKAAV